MRYAELLPAVDLRPYVRCFWTMRSDGGGGTERIVPDGLPEIIVNLGDSFNRELAGSGTRRQGSLLVVGQLRTALTTKPSGNVDLFGIRFEPAGLRAVLGCSMQELTDEDVSLQDISKPVFRALNDAVRTPPTRNRAPHTENVLRREIEYQRLRGSSQNTLARTAATHIEKKMNSSTVRGVAEALSVSGRTLERAFAAEIGITPKEFIRINRLQRVIRLIELAPKTPNWAGLAATGGYCDQSHLIREFGLLTGTTPQKYVRERTGFMDAFVGA